VGQLRLFSWNVNGLRACARKGFVKWLREEKPDVLALQEVRATEEQLEEAVSRPKGFETYFHPAERKGYSGVALYCSTRPDEVVNGALDEPRFDTEGRLQLAHFGKLSLLSGYYPNGGRDLERVDYKLEFSEAVLQRALQLRQQGREVVLCGDFNTAHEEIDLANPRSNVKNTGFLPVERAWISRLIEHGFVDVFRQRHPDEAGHYTWWSNRKGVRERNVGWRIDYFFVSQELEHRVVSIRHHPEVGGSDHCPIELMYAVE